MTFQFSFRKMDTSDALQEYTKEKFNKIFTHLGEPPIRTRIVFSVEGIENKVQCDIHGAHGHDIQAHHSGNDMYAAVDKMIGKVDSQVRKMRK